MAIDPVQRREMKFKQREQTSIQEKLQSERADRSLDQELGLQTACYRLWIPATYSRQPLLSRLVSRFGLVVNILAALLEGRNHQGCFDLSLQGSPDRLQAGLDYLRALDVEVLALKNFFQIGSGLPLQLTGAAQQPQEHDRTHILEKHLQILVSQNERTHPIFADLVRSYGLTVTITSAFFVPDVEDGWFDLELWGSAEQVKASLKYLQQKQLAIL
uniref:NIL domain-containing protein n=1 Tax=Cyanothece sp. (strain PCC 7425 / ATCC 29141) TaxID=395961 RepID=B8HKU9_CYAP4